MARNPIQARGVLRAFATAVALAALILAAWAPAAGATPGKFWGVVPQATPSVEQLQRLKRGGVDSIRIPVAWSAVQPTNGGPFDWSGTDILVKGAATAGIEVLPFLTGAPSWAVPQITVRKKNGTVISALRNLPVRGGVQRSGWRNFLRQAVLRYGPNGSFWAENPDLVKRPMRVWQIWNEPNFMYFVARPNPAEYGKLVNLSYSALRSADRGAKIVLAGLFSRPIEATERYKPPLAYFASKFIDQMYRRTPGIKKKFIGIALHPYTGVYQRLTPYVEEIRKILESHRDGGKGLWITELGWSSQPRQHGNSFAKGPSGQAAQLKGAFRLLKRNQKKWKVKRVYWFSIDDQAGSCNFCDGSGLFGEGFAPKPAWSAYVRFAGGTAG